MKNYLLINPDHPGNYYSLFYALAFLAGFLLLMIEGRKRKFQLIPWMLVIATAFLFFIVGCRLITFSPIEWSYLRNFKPIPYSTGRSVLGGILFSIPGILLAKKCLRFKVDMMDAFAFVLPVALVVERFGCLMAGCCYGTPTFLPWAIQYGPASHAFAQHVHDKLLPADSLLALPVHPVQFYEVLCCVAIVVMLSKLRARIKAPGNLFLTSIALYGAFRFLLEFVRDSGVSIGNETPLSYVQWLILLIVPTLFLLIMNREKKIRPDRSAVSAVRNSFLLPAGYFLLIGLLFLFVSRWLNTVEILSFNIVLVPMLAVLTWYLFTWATLPRYRVASLMLPVASLFLMNQTVPEYSKGDSTRISYNYFSLGVMAGNATLTSTYEDCSGVTQSEEYEHNYSASALGIGRTIQLEHDKSVSFGVTGFGGSHREVASVSANGSPGPGINTDQTFSYFGIRPYLQYDWRKFGIGAGFNVGKLGTISTEPVNSTSRQFDFSPSFNIRFGNLTKAFVEYKLGSQFPTSFPAMNHQLAMGIGFGKRDGSALRFGSASYVSLFVAPTIPAGSHFIIEPFLGIGQGIASGYKGEGLTGSLALHYKFNRIEKK